MPFGPGRRDDHRVARAPAVGRLLPTLHQAMSIRVGIVEDDRCVRENLAILIDQTPGFSCAAACASAEEALKRLPDSAPDVVLMGHSLARPIRH
jgi:hypothetical protein